MAKTVSDLPHLPPIWRGTKEISISIPHNFKARDYQIPFFEAMAKGCKRACVVWHRRAGKDKTFFNFTVMRAAKEKGIYYYFFPTFSQGRKALWDNLDKQGFRTIDHCPKELIDGSPNNTEMKMRLRNGSIIQIIGTDNIDSIVGTNPRGCVFSEYSLQSPTAWQLIRPILAENSGWAIFNFTPRGHNHGKELYDMAKRDANWFAQLLTVEDTGAINAEVIEEERQAGMSEDWIQQEFYCSFTRGVEGNYYSKYIEAAHEENRIGAVPYQRQSRVYTAWDIGIGDSCSIIFFQIVGNSVHVIDYYENHGEGLPHYADVLYRRPYLYADHFAPHDVANRSFSSGLSTQEVASGLGIKFVVLPTLKITIEAGIEAARGIFPRVYIDENHAKKLIVCLENYRKEFDERLQTYKSRPLHDKYSHGADAFRYLAIGVKLYVDNASVGISDGDADRLLDIYQPRFAA